MRRENAPLLFSFLLSFFFIWSGSPCELNYPYFFQVVGTFRIDIPILETDFTQLLAKPSCVVVGTTEPLPFVNSDFLMIALTSGVRFYSLATVCLLCIIFSSDTPGLSLTQTHPRQWPLKKEGEGRRVRNGIGIIFICLFVSCYFFFFFLMKLPLMLRHVLL